LKKNNITFIFNKEIFIEKYDFSVFKKNVSKIINIILKKESYRIDKINFNFCDDKEIKFFNKKYLKHNYETDILTFKYEDGILIESDIIISVETILRNSKRYKTGFNNELYRVIIHGILHICNYDDNNSDDKKLMKSKENFYLNILKI